MNRLLPFFLLALAPLALAAEAPMDRLLAPLRAAPAESARPAAESAYIAPAVPKDAAPKTTLGGDELVMALEKQLGEHFATDGEVKLALLRAWNPVKLPVPEWSMVITEWPTGGIASTFYVRFRIVSDGQTVADVQMPVRAQLLEEVWIASARLEKGQPLDRSVLAVQKINVIGEHNGLVTAKTDPTTLELTQSVQAGRALTRAQVTTRPLVRKGQVVEAVADKGGLSVRMKALALESGAAGELIRLRNLESRKDFNGQILNESKVQVHF